MQTGMKPSSNIISPAVLPQLRCQAVPAAHAAAPHGSAPTKTWLLRQVRVSEGRYSVAWAASLQGAGTPVCVEIRWLSGHVLCCLHTWCEYGKRPSELGPGSSRQTSASKSNHYPPVAAAGCTGAKQGPGSGEGCATAHAEYGKPRPPLAQKARGVPSVLR